MAHLLWARHGHHAQFLYDRGIPLWAGKTIGWLFSRLGGISIQRGKLDLPALRTARELLLHGAYPFAAAPEGATNGHNELVSSLEPGMAQLAFWTAADLARAGRTEQVEILPIGLQYFYEAPVWEAVEGLLNQLENSAGLSSPPPGSSLEPEQLYDRLLRLGETILEMLESFYREAYRQPAQAPEMFQCRRPGRCQDRRRDRPFRFQSRGGSSSPHRGAGATPVGYGPWRPGTVLRNRTQGRSGGAMPAA